MPFASGCSRGGLRIACVAVVIFFATTAQAQAPDDVQRARAAYDRGIAAHARGDFSAAAQEFALADSILPNPTALESALKDAVLADDAVLGMTLVERSEHGSASGPLALAVSAARDKFAGRVGQIIVRCSVACRVTIDDRQARLDKVTWVLPGRHLVELAEGGRVERRSVDVAARQRIEVRPAPPAPAKPSSQPIAPRDAPAVAPPTGRPQESSGISSAWFWGGAALTASLGGVTLWSGLDTKSKHEAFESAPTVSGQSDGRDAQTRTNVLLGATAVAAVCTAAIGAFAVRWSSPGNRSAAARRAARILPRSGPVARAF